ncbi:hypothetical protein C8Q80DRAFT_1271471 [Daedaleopsis nitida]|nr:hypothetical protein C8Q80DRAFT_1271471 [Daedaleopsis nitida]
MPPQRKALARRTALLTGSFYDKSGAINDGLPSPTVARNPDRDFDFYASTISQDAGGAGSDDEYTLTGYGELSTEDAFMLPPSPTQTIKYRYRAYRPKLARIGKKYRMSANGRTPLKTKSSAYHPSDYSAILGPYLPGMSAGRSPKRDFAALMHKYRDSAEGWRDSDTAISPRKTFTDKAWPASGATATSTSNLGRRGVPGCF